MHENPAPETVTDAVAALLAEGYTANFQLIDGMLTSDADCPACTVAEAAVERLYRFEGPSDPGDEMIVFGLRDTVSGTRGTLASAYGPSADPDLFEHLSDLRRRFE